MEQETSIQEVREKLVKERRNKRNKLSELLEVLKKTSLIHEEEKEKGNNGEF